MRHNSDQKRWPIIGDESKRNSQKYAKKAHKLQSMVGSDLIEEILEKSTLEWLNSLSELLSK